MPAVASAAAGFPAENRNTTFRVKHARLSRRGVFAVGTMNVEA